jgi:hypothetical protein
MLREDGMIYDDGTTRLLGRRFRAMYVRTV